MNEKLNTIFDLTPSEVITRNREVILPDTDKIDYDYKTTRSNLHSLLMTGQEALNRALEIADSSEAPRAFEVVGNLMKQLADINQQLLDLHNQKQKLDTVQQKDVTTQNITNNAVFVGSTTELSKYLNTINEKGLN
jgi:hypothetical protein